MVAKFAFTYAAGVGDALYVVGVARELEDRDVHHTILWERLAGSWKRYQWKNRCYGVAAYAADGGSVVAIMGFDGHLKIRSTVRGSSEEVADASGDGPSSLRPLEAIRCVEDHLYVCGMRRMVYRRRLGASAWERFDTGMRLEQRDVSTAGLYAIDGDAGALFAAGSHGEIWAMRDGSWERCQAPTTERLGAIRCLGGGITIAAGARGALLVSSGSAWVQVEHDYPAETFSCIEHMDGRVLVASETGSIFELQLASTPRLLRADVPRASWVAATNDRLYLVDETSVTALGANGQVDASPPLDLLT